METTTTKPETEKKRFTNPKFYGQIGRMVRESVERTYGKGWKNCFSRDVACALVAREAFFIVLGGAREGIDATVLEEHGRETYKAGLKACGLEDDAE